jgi:NADPH2:quinone reductase
MSMQAIHFPSTGGASVLELTTVPIPTLSSPYDILVKIRGCALNPVDTKIREGAFEAPPILGFDGAGIVEAAGDQALFKKGESVMFAGIMGRAGTNAQYCAMDSRIAAKKPDGLDWAQAAALPLVGLTAWEVLEGHFGLRPGKGSEREETIVIVNGAGGVGSMATQLARKVSTRGYAAKHIWALTMCITEGIWNQECCCNRISPRDHRVGEEEWRDACTQPPQRPWHVGVICTLLSLY